MKIVNIPIHENIPFFWQTPKPPFFYDHSGSAPLPFTFILVTKHLTLSILLTLRSTSYNKEQQQLTPPPSIRFRHGVVQKKNPHFCGRIMNLLLTRSQTWVRVRVRYPLLIYPMIYSEDGNLCCSLVTERAPASPTRERARSNSDRSHRLQKFCVRSVSHARVTAAIMTLFENPSTSRSTSSTRLLLQMRGLRVTTASARCLWPQAWQVCRACS